MSPKDGIRIRHLPGSVIHYSDKSIRFLATKVRLGVSKTSRLGLQPVVLVRAPLWLTNSPVRKSHG